MKEYINIPITEFDLQDFKDIVYDNDTITWVFNTSEGREVELRFMSQDEYEQREK